MITAEGLFYIKQLIISRKLTVVLLFDGKECVFPGYSSLDLDINKWKLDDNGDLVQDDLVYALHDKQLTMIDTVRIIADNEIILSDEKVEHPYILRYKDDFVKIKVKLSLNSL